MKKSEHEIMTMVFWANIVSFFLVGMSLMGMPKTTAEFIRAMVVACLPVSIAFLSGLALVAEHKKNRQEIKEIKEEPPAPEHTAVEVLESIAALIRFYGEKMPKKHGEWIVLKLNDGHFFSMDSWNGAIYFMSGDPVYNYWTGFSGDGKESAYLGLSDKGWRAGDEPPLTTEEYRAYYDKIAAFINEQTVKKRELANANL